MLRQRECVAMAAGGGAAVEKGESFREGFIEVGDIVVFMSALCRREFILCNCLYLCFYDVCVCLCVGVFIFGIVLYFFFLTIRFFGFFFKLPPWIIKNNASCIHSLHRLCLCISIFFKKSFSWHSPTDSNFVLFRLIIYIKDFAIPYHASFYV